MRPEKLDTTKDYVRLMLDDSIDELGKKDIPFLKGMNPANPLRIKRPERDLDPCHRLDRPV